MITNDFSSQLVEQAALVNDFIQKKQLKDAALPPDRATVYLKNGGEEFTEPKFKIALDAFFCKEISEGLGMDKEELFGYFNSSSADWDDGSSADGGDGDNTPSSEQSGRESRWRWQRENWNAPISHQGEIGLWREDKEGNRFFDPQCNFDFQVEREIEDADGGGIVLQIKRSFEDKQVRVILNSTDYTKPDVFTDALKRAIKTGIVCNLSKTQLNALIHTRLQEYRTTRKGELFKRIDRYGQQADGTWVLGEGQQFKKDGTPTNENESGWVFNPSLGKEDFIPCPELAPENPLALKRLVDASRAFFGSKNIYQLLLTIGWTVAGLNFKEIFAQNSSFPILNSFGVPGSCKTIAAETAASLIGRNWPEFGILVRVSTSALYELGSKLGSIPFIWDDPAISDNADELAKNWYNCKPRRVRGNQQTPHSPMGITSNQVIGGEQNATFTRIVRVAYDLVTGGDKAAFQELKAAQAEASGAFPQLIALGYPKKAIDEIESELLQYLPHAHARIAQSLAIVTWYAQKMVDMTGGTENIKQWVIENCCGSENDSDASGDSLKDYLDKILTLESENSIGAWNFKRNVERDGHLYHALYAHDAWKLLDHRFKPATYNERSLKALVIKAGGITNVTARFSCDRDQAITYNRSLLNIREYEGEKIYPAPVPTLPRKAWLIPAALWGEEEELDKPVTNPVTTVTDCNQNPVTPSNPDEIRDFEHSNTNCNHVTKKNELEKEKEDEKQFNTIVNPTTPGVEPCNQSSGYTGYTPLESQKTEENQDFQPVTTTDPASVTSSNAVTELEPIQDANPQHITASELLRRKIIDLWSQHTELGKLLIEIPKKEFDEALAGFTSKEKTFLNILAIKEAIARSNFDLITELTHEWEQEFKVDVWKKLSGEEREVVKQLASKTEPKEPNSWENAPIIENLIESTEGLNKSVLPDISDDESTVPEAEVIVQQPSLLELKKKEYDITEFVGHLIEVRSDNSGTVKFTGNMISYDERNGFIVIMTEEAERKNVYLFEAFVIG